ETMLRGHDHDHVYQLEIFYTNIEGEAINRIYQAVDEGFDGLVMNPAGFTYAGFALKDCIKGAGLPYVEVHISSIAKRNIHCVVATQMAVEDFGRTLLGKKIEIVSADHQNKPDVGANVARQWIDKQGVDVIVDVPVSSVAFAVQQIAKERNRALLISSSGSSDLTGKSCSPTSVHWTYDTYALAQTAGKAMMQQG